MHAAEDELLPDGDDVDDDDDDDDEVEEDPALEEADDEELETAVLELDPNELPDELVEAAEEEAPEPADDAAPKDDAEKDALEAPPDEEDPVVASATHRVATQVAPLQSSSAWHRSPHVPHAGWHTCSAAQSTSCWQVNSNTRHPEPPRTANPATIQPNPCMAPTVPRRAPTREPKQRAVAVASEWASSASERAFDAYASGGF